MKKELEKSIKKDNVDMDELIDKFTPYVKTIIYNMVGDNLSYEDKEESKYKEKGNMAMNEKITV